MRIGLRQYRNGRTQTIAPKAGAICSRSRRARPFAVDRGVQRAEELTPSRCVSASGAGTRWDREWTRRSGRCPVVAGTDGQATATERSESARSVPTFFRGEQFGGVSSPRQSIGHHSFLLLFFACLRDLRGLRVNRAACGCHGAIGEALVRAKLAEHAKSAKHGKTRDTARAPTARPRPQQTAHRGRSATPSRPPPVATIACP